MIEVIETKCEEVRKEGGRERDKTHVQESQESQEGGTPREGGAS